MTNGGVQGYRVFRNGSYLKFVATTSTSDTGLATFTQYKYEVQAIDGSGNLSAKSTEVAATTDDT